MAKLRFRFQASSVDWLNWAIFALLGLLYGPLLLHWADGWLNKSISIQHEYFSHGLFGLPLAAYLAWNQRHRWAALPNTSHWSGGILVGLAAVLYASQLSDWMNLSFPLMLVGLVLGLKGWAGVKLQGFPLVLVALATPTQLPYLIEPYIVPLQHFIASVAGFILVQTGAQVTVEQIYVFVNGQTIEVAPHCAGLKILFTCLYIAMILAYWTGLWTSKLRTSLFILGTLMVSILGNILRNTVLSYLHGTGREEAFHWLHEGWGGDVYYALVLLSLIGLLQGIQHFVPPSLALSPDPPNPTV